MLLTWSCVRSSWEWAQLEQLRLPGHLLLPDVMNLKEEKWSFPLSAFKQAESLAQGKAQSHRQVVTGFPASLLQRCAETVQGPVRKGQISPQKSFKLGLCKLRTNCNCPNSPSVRSSQECWTQLPWHLKTQQGALSSFYLTFSHRAFQNTFENLLRQASYIYNIILTTATQRLSILHSLLGKKSPL